MILDEILEVVVGVVGLVEMWDVEQLIILSCTMIKRKYRCLKTPNEIVLCFNYTSWWFQRI